MPESTAPRPAPLPTQPYRGTRDLFPQAHRLRTWLYSVIRETMDSFGYEEYQGPFLEHLELYAAKSSEEIVREQLYSFQDRGERMVAIRPEMTPTLARMVASRVRELPRPIRWYSIPTCMRYERPQRGRLREFDQLNVDVLGGLPTDEDVEVVLVSIELMRRIGAKQGDFMVRMNHRGIVNDFVFGVLEVAPAAKGELFRLMDKRDKLDAPSFGAQLATLGIDQTRAALLDRFLAGDLDTIRQILPEGNPHVAAMTERLDILSSVAPGFVVFDPGIMRGFDYYTAMVFEIFDTHPENRRALFGGGRYDDLVSAFGVEKLPGIGYGVSDVSLINFMETHGLTPPLPKRIDVAVLRFTEGDRLEALKLAATLRNEGLSVESPATPSKFGKQIQAAERNGATVVAFRGGDELRDGTVAVKWLQSGTQESIAIDNLGDLAVRIKGAR